GVFAESAPLSSLCSAHRTGLPGRECDRLGSLVDGGGRPNFTADSRSGPAIYHLVIPPDAPVPVGTESGIQSGRPGLLSPSAPGLGLVCCDPHPKSSGPAFSGASGLVIVRPAQHAASAIDRVFRRGGRTDCPAKPPRFICPGEMEQEPAGRPFTKRPAPRHRPGFRK